MKKRIFLFLILFLAYSIGGLHADTVYLSNGRTMQGNIRKETKDMIELEIEGGIVRLPMHQILRIDKSPLTRPKPMPVQNEPNRMHSKEELSYGEYIEKEELERNPELKEILRRHIISKEIVEEAKRSSFIREMIEKITAYVRKMLESKEAGLKLDRDDLEKNPELEYALKSRMLANKISDKVNKELESNLSIRLFLDKMLSLLRERLRR